MNSPQSFVHEFLRRLEASRPPARASSGELLPRYNFRDASTARQQLVAQSQPRSFVLGTGASLFTHALVPAIVSARSEVIFVTCFWAPSRSLSALRDALARLARHRAALIRDALARGEPAIPPLTVRICFSSRSLLQKLLHPQSRGGYVYPPPSWPRKLGLPDPALLEAAAIHLRVKSLFFLPFSVMHPKFVVIDRQRALVPSCNVSWEPWLEGCVEFTGDAVRALLSFYSLTWDDTFDLSQPLADQDACGASPRPFDARQAGLAVVPSSAHCHIALPGFPSPPLTLVLPSPCHRNPRFRPFPWQKHPAPPSTPLNVALLQLFDQARRSIYVQTPNLTSEPALAALLDALGRGVDVTIVTNRSMMVLEQLVTAGTITSWCVRSLIRRFRQLRTARKGRRVGSGTRLMDTSSDDNDVEPGRPSLGRLRISYFHGRPGDNRRHSAAEPSEGEEEPVHSHLKLTLVDDEYTMLGSGNMDRASWFTSQELGLLFHHREFATTVRAAVDSVLEGRLDLVFDSEVE